MDHIRADNEVERARLQLLFRGRFFEIENLELDLGKGGQLFAGAGEKGRRDVAKNIGMQAALELRQGLRGEPAGAGANLENAQAASFRQSARGAGDGGGDGGEPVTGEEAVAVKLVEQLRADAGEEDLDGVLFAAQDRAELVAIAFAEERFGKMPGVSLNIIAQHLAGGIGGLGKTSGRLPAGFGLAQQFVPNETGGEPGKSRAHRGRDAQGIGIESCLGHDTHLAQAARQLAGREIVRRRQRSFQLGTSADRENFFERVLRDRPELVERERCQRGFCRLVRRALPGDVISQVARAARPLRPARAGQADRPETIHQDGGLSGLIINRDVALDEIIGKLPHGGVHLRCRPGRTEEKDAPEADRQLHSGLPIFDRRGAGGEDMERAVEENRMEGEFAGPRRDRVR